MPTKTVAINAKTLTLDARPDRLDLRDLPFRPPVKNLPLFFPTDADIAALVPSYIKAGLILDQKSQGACTGFGLAAVINFLNWKSALNTPHPTTLADLVSPRMLYHLARFYDEWPGQDYEGSSCRGALKGWHRHGVCLETFWPYNNGFFVRPNKGWEENAIRQPLGIYYRIQKDSVVDMQAAITETGAIYVSGNVHKGWSLSASLGKPPSHKSLPVIKPSKEMLGGHAFAIVGYNNIGFIAQNSWGTAWGWSGFAVLPYDDWVANGGDAWVMGLGVPVARIKKRIGATLAHVSPRHFVQSSGRSQASEGFAGFFGAAPDPLKLRTDAWDEEAAYWHCLVMGNDGAVINRLPHVENEQDNIKFVGLEQPLAWFKQQEPRTPRCLAIYAHGGLNSENESIRRIRILGPNFTANGIYPIFITWKSGWMEILADMISDKLNEMFGTTPLPSKGISDYFIEKTDRLIEVLCGKILVRSMWSEMKENVSRSSAPGRGMDLLADQLKELSDASKGNLEIHLAGHSAGSFVCGRLLSEFAHRELSAESCTLFAPACDLEFALAYYMEAISTGRLKRSRFFIHALSDALEQDDSVGPYRKSLLYLVSRALERWHKTPLLGLAAAFDSDCNTSEFWHEKGLDLVKDWQQFFWKRSAQPTGFAKTGKGSTYANLAIVNKKQINTGQKLIKSSHGAFDNSITHISALLETMRGEALIKKVTALDY